MNKNTDTVNVRKKRLEMLITYFASSCCNCSDCPASDVCDKCLTCEDALWGYLKEMRKL